MNRHEARREVRECGWASGRSGVTLDAAEGDELAGVARCDSSESCAADPFASVFSRTAVGTA